MKVETKVVHFIFVFILYKEKPNIFMLLSKTRFSHFYYIKSSKRVRIHCIDYEKYGKGTRR